MTFEDAMREAYNMPEIPILIRRPDGGECFEMTETGELMVVDTGRGLDGIHVHTMLDCNDWVVEPKFKET